MLLRINLNDAETFTRCPFILGIRFFLELYFVYLISFISDTDTPMKLLLIISTLCADMMWYLIYLPGSTLLTTD